MEPDNRCVMLAHCHLSADFGTRRHAFPPVDVRCVPWAGEVGREALCTENHCPDVISEDIALPPWFTIAVHCAGKNVNKCMRVADVKAKSETLMHNETKVHSSFSHRIKIDL